LQKQKQKVIYSKTKNQTTNMELQKVTEVFSTKDYYQFSVLKGNRKINKFHLDRLKRSILEQQLIVPIVVNAQLEIIDGQHRFEICKELNLPVYFIKNDSYGLREVQRINSNFSVWKTDDYVDAYASEGNEEYIYFSEFRKKYALQPRTCLILLTGRQSTRYMDNLEMGQLKITNEAFAVKVADMLLEIREHYAGYNRRSFVTAMIQVINNAEYDHQFFLSQLERQPFALKDCTSKSYYLKNIELIYNYHQHESKKVRFF
jgi:ParB/Sulfiredoxin domain